MFPLQNLTNCKCKTFFGSVSEMKGNEARVVLFLHPVKDSKEGHVSKAKPKSMLPKCRSIILILGIILVLGVLIPGADPFNLSNLYLYGMIASSSLLMAYIAIMFAIQVDLGSRILQGWKRARGQPIGDEKHLLHTLPYYLAITRSSCEVSLFWDSSQIFWGYFHCTFM